MRAPTPLLWASLAVTFAVSLAACRGGSDESPATRHVESKEDHCSFDAPAGFSERRDRGALVLVGAGDAARSTIAIRAVGKDAWAEPRTPETVVPATATTLAALPGARVRGPVEVEHPAYRAVELDVDFAPASKHGARYERRHVVVFADTQVFHVVATAPAGRLGAIRAEVDRVVDSLREEG